MFLLREYFKSLILFLSRGGEGGGMLASIHCCLMQIFLDQWDHVCLSAPSTASKIERISNFVFQLADKPRVKASLASYFPHQIDRDSNDPDTAGPIRPL